MEKTYVNGKKTVQMKERDEIVTPFASLIVMQISIPLFLLNLNDIQKILNENPCNLMKPIWYYGKGVHRTG